ncbi:MAG TPA: hypothetical protein DF613_11055 [Lachnospiraceae bacterium]|nr:hypothetical protein [Lachnospiraceae bacterium]
MRFFRQTLAVAGYNFRQWERNPRIVITFLLDFILCFLLSDKVVAFAKAHEKTTQLAEAFVWTFGNSSSILLTSVLLILLFADMPFLTSGTPFYLVRISRRVWVAGQALYVTAATGLYMAFTFLSTVVLCMRNSFPGDKWSPTAVILGYQGSNVVLPASLKVMEATTPYRCAAVIFLLMLLYALVLVFLMLVFSLYKGQAAGVVSAFIFTIYGILLDPNTFMKLFKLSEVEKYKANVAVGWLSPLNHATYAMHNFGHDLLPTLSQTGIVLGVLLAFLGIAAWRIMQNYNFSFTGTEM